MTIINFKLKKKIDSVNESNKNELIADFKNLNTQLNTRLDVLKPISTADTIRRENKRISDINQKIDSINDATSLKEIKRIGFEIINLLNNTSINGGTKKQRKSHKYLYRVKINPKSTRRYKKQNRTMRKRYY
jgi:hypothetical protein